MKIEQVFWLLIVQILFLFSTIKNTVSVNGQCLDDQRSHLWDLKNNISFDSKLSTRLVQWNLKEDCCSWRGVGCDAFGRVITLELNQEHISCRLDSLISLFRLRYLEKLNLEDNSFIDITPFPKEFANLTNLVYLNLAYSGVARPTMMKLENPTLKRLVQNLSNIEELYLDGVDLSSQGSDWFQVIATSLPKLRVLSLYKCHLSGPLNISSSSMNNLTVIRLDQNNISAEVPEFFGNMPNLRSLSLSSCELLGRFPEKIFQVPTLQTLDISYNKLLQGSLPPFPENSSLTEMVLSYTSFSGSLPTIGYLHMLSKIFLSHCNFSGTIPALPNLSYLDLAANKFSGPVPQFQASDNLVHIDLSNNSLTGSLSSVHFKGLQSLERLDLSYNFLSGSLPSSIFKLPALNIVKIQHNQFSGQIAEIPDSLSISPTRLEYLDLSFNQFNGSFPKFFFELKELIHLFLSSNSFTDTIGLETFKNVHNLTTLDLSYNNLTVETQSDNSSILEKLIFLSLASCKLKNFPELKGRRLIVLDLSDNGITGEIPNWIWTLGLSILNLSSNSFVGLQKPYKIPGLVELDLHSNQLQGDLPIFSPYTSYVDFSGNKFSGLSSLIGLQMSNVLFLSISNNSLTGSIPDSICNALYLQILDLSYNDLNGTIPSCMMTSMTNTLGVLNLAGNNLSGSIPDTLPTNCRLTTLDLGRNHLQGEVPITLSNCTELEVLNLGHNNIEDVFPCLFENSSSLRVLILRSNKFQGELECFGYNYTWPQLQIIDIASNNLSGVLSTEFFSCLKTMLIQDSHIGDKLGFTVSSFANTYYQFKVGVTMKGLEIELAKILTIFTSIDFSNNKFSGKIPKSIGDLKALHVVDFSYNEFTGGIPSSIGKLDNIESLDLSRNQLIGEIPSTLTDLGFLSFLNLSFNILTGRIPTGPQFQTFPNDSYIGNVGLCGFPLDVRCSNANDSGSSGMPSLSNKKEIAWMYVCASLGYTVGLGIFSMLLLFSERWRNKFFLQVDRLLVKVLGKKIAKRNGPEWREPIRRL